MKLCGSIQKNKYWKQLMDGSINNTSTTGTPISLNSLLESSLCFLSSEKTRNGKVKINAWKLEPLQDMVKKYYRVCRQSSNWPL